MSVDGELVLVQQSEPIGKRHPQKHSRPKAKAEPLPQGQRPRARLAGSSRRGLWNNRADAARCERGRSNRFLGDHAVEPLCCDQAKPQDKALVTEKQASGTGMRRRAPSTPDGGAGLMGWESQFRVHPGLVVAESNASSLPHRLGFEGAMLSRIAQSNIARAKSPRKHAVLLLAGMLSGCRHKGADARRVPRKHGTRGTLPTPPILVARCVQRRGLMPGNRRHRVESVLVRAGRDCGWRRDARRRRAAGVNEGDMEVVDDSAQRNAAASPRKRRYEIVGVHGRINEVPGMNSAVRRLRVSLSAGARTESRHEYGSEQQGNLAHGLPRLLEIGSDRSIPRNRGRIATGTIASRRKSNFG